MTRVSDKDFRAVKKEIKNCCNYDSGTCLVLDCDCPQMITQSISCRWFRDAVLPDNKELYNLIYNRDKLATCKCGKKYMKTGNRQTMCPECSKERRRKKRQEYNRNQYDKKR